MTQQSPAKMFVLLPMLYFMGKVDFENPNILMMARTSFFLCQIIQFLTAVYLKHAIMKKNDTTIIFIPAKPENPWAAPTDVPVEMKETTYLEHETTKAKEFLNQSLMGAVISTGIHFYFKVNQVVLIQSVMIPMNLFENVLVRAILLGRPQGKRIWDELLAGEDTVPTVAAPEVSAIATSAEVKKKVVPESPEEAILFTWDEAASADFEALYERIKLCPNVSTHDEHWTSLMVACGSPVDPVDFIKKALLLKADVTSVDSDGWTACHWAAFHNRPNSAKTLLENISSNDAKNLLEVKDGDNKSAKDVALAEGNTDVVDVLEKFATTLIVNDSEAESSLRQRKTNKSTPISDID